MFATNIIAVEDCPNRRATCQDCALAIVTSHPRVRTPQRKYYHLNCYKPTYPVTILPSSDVTSTLHSAENQSAFSQWTEKWNEQFRPRGITSLPIQTVPTFIPISRAHIEIFKFLTCKEVCLLVGLTCKAWKVQGWSQELWVDFLARDFPCEVRASGVSAREGYIRLRAQTCLACSKTPPNGQLRVICPVSQRPICSNCFQKPGSSVFKINEYATLMGVSKDYMREAEVPVYAYNNKHWVFSHLADSKIHQFRVKRRAEMLESLTKMPNFFKSKDLQKVESLNPSRAKYIGVILRHKFKGEEDLIDLLQFIFSASEKKGMSLTALVKRNRRRRLREVKGGKGTV